MNFIFFGSGKFSWIILEELLENNYQPSLLITIPSKTNQKGKIIPLFFKEKTKELGFKILEPQSLKDEKVNETIKENQPQFGIVAQYGKIIPKNIIDLFKFGILNVHPSLLPKYRGANPIQNVLYNGEKLTGVSIILIDELIDHGPILAQKEITIDQNDDFESLYLKSAEISKNLLVETLNLYLANKIIPKPQDDSEATFCRKFQKEDCWINLSDEALKIYNQIRALSFEPGCFLEFFLKNNQKLVVKIIKAKLIDQNTLNSNPGVKEIKKELYLMPKKGLILIEKIQTLGKRVMAGSEFLNGYRQKLIML